MLCESRDIVCYAARQKFAARKRYHCCDGDDKLLAGWQFVEDGLKGQTHQSKAHHNPSMLMQLETCECINVNDMT